MSKLEDSKIIKKVSLGSIDQSISLYSVANLRNEKIYFSGGRVSKDGAAIDRVIEFDLRSGRPWDAPSMNYPRLMHESCVHNEHLFVFCGQSSYKG